MTHAFRVIGILWGGRGGEKEGRRWGEKGWYMYSYAHIYRIYIYIQCIYCRLPRRLSSVCWPVYRPTVVRSKKRKLDPKMFWPIASSGYGNWHGLSPVSRSLHTIVSYHDAISTLASCENVLFLPKAYETPFLVFTRHCKNAASVGIFSQQVNIFNDDVMTWKHFLHYHTFVRGKHRWFLWQRDSNMDLWWFLWCYPEQIDYRKISNIRRTKSQNLNDPRLILQLSLPNQLKPGVKWTMKM